MALRGRLQERLLVHLVLNRNQTVPLTRLVEAVWDDEYPETAWHQVRKMVSDLRKRLPPLKGLLTTSGPGYRLTLDDNRVDQGRFQTGLHLAREALRQGQQQRAVGHLNSALSLWRGPLLDGNGSRLIQAAADALEERRIASLEQFFDIHLATGRPDAVLDKLWGEVNSHPSRETLRGQLMLALYRRDRQAEALDEYHKLRRILDETHAVEPGPGISALYQRILRGDPDLATPRSAGPGDDPAALPESLQVNTLPYDLPDFTGRNRDLDILHAVGSGSSPEPIAGAERSGGPRIVAIDGMGGSGKSTLAIHAAHRLAVQHPDGQLYVDLQGFTPGAQPMSADEALAILLGSMGDSDEYLPSNSQLHSARWRAMTSRRRLLLVLDNAVSAAQLQPLLPNSSESLVIVTSRRRLPDLDGAVSLSPGMLSPTDSIELLEGVLGSSRVRSEIDQAHRIAELCGFLPLALRICAARLQHRTHRSLEQLAERLAEQSRTVEELSSGERSLGASLRTSYEALDADHRTALTLLGSLPGPDFDSHSAAAILERGLVDTESILEGLLDVHLLEQRTSNRYSFHDLVRAFTIAQLKEEGARQDQALARLMGYHARVSDVACAQLFPGRAGLAETEATSAAPMPTIVDVESALSWFDAEQRSLLAVLQTGARTPLHDLTCQIARNLVFYLHMRGTADGLHESAVIGLAAARALGDGKLVRTSLANVAVALWRSGEPRKAAFHLEEALCLSEGAADVPAQVSILNRLSACHERVGQYAEAEAVLLQTLALLREHPAPQEEATARNSLSMLYTLRCRFSDARAQAESALRLGSAVDTSTRMNVLNTLAVALLGQGEPAAAADHLAEALSLDQKMGGTQAGVQTLGLLAETSLALGHLRRARESIETALDRLDGGDRFSVHSCATLRIAGRVLLAFHDYAQARECHTSALRFAEASNYRLEIARAHAGLAAVAECEGQGEPAALHQAVAASIFDDLGIPAEWRADGSHRPCISG
ncbi:BTAD domain-containing putative transcriptional regulator [Streptomyces sioyaensis]|uniref:AfsR/SARP family transcriptional regulator n=1 Tax=Streptomyces sioyaensis TaxID=67364 RepID=UPI0036E0AA46